MQSISEDKIRRWRRFTQIGSRWLDAEICVHPEIRG